MTIYLHIGSNKTGTTSLQTLFHDLSAQLARERSLYYPPRATNHRAIAMPFLNGRPFRPLDVFLIAGRGTRDDFLRQGKELIKDIRSAARRHHTILLSSEQIRLLDPETVGALATFLKGLGHRVKVLIYVRHPAERVSSEVCQDVRSGRRHLADYVTIDSTGPAIRTYAAAFGVENMIVRRFGPSYFEGGDLLGDMLAAIGQPPMPGQVAPRLNTALSLPAVMIADQHSGGDEAIRERPLRERYLSKIAGPPFRATRAMAEQAVEAHAQTLDELDRLYGVRFDPVDLATFPEKLPTDFSDETLTSIAMALYQQNCEIAALEREALVHRRDGSPVSRVAPWPG